MTENLISALLDSISPKEAKQIENKMLIAAAIADGMEAKGWNKTEFLEKLGRKSPSTITRWLSGTHNFTTDTLTEIGEVLGINLLNVDIEEDRPIINAYTIFVQSIAPERERLSDSYGGDMTTLNDLLFQEPDNNFAEA